VKQRIDGKVRAEFVQRFFVQIQMEDLCQARKEFLRDGDLGA